MNEVLPFSREILELSSSEINWFTLVLMNSPNMKQNHNESKWRKEKRQIKSKYDMLFESVVWLMSPS